MAVTIEDHQEAPSQPAPQDVVSLFNKSLDSAPATPQAPEPLTAVETPQASAPATIAIPVDRVPEKFKQKPEAVFEAYENAERAMHQRANEASQFRREADELRAKLAAAEQFAKLQQQPKPPEVDPWGGLKPEEAVITDTRRFAESIRTQAVEEARKAAREETDRVKTEVRQDQSNRDSATALVKTWDAARDMIRASGHQISDEQWKADLGYIAPAVVRENDQAPGVVLNPKRYVEHYNYLRGAPPKPSIPTEASPPISGRPSVIAAQQPESIPSISRETRQTRETIAAAMKSHGLMNDKEVADYLKAADTPLNYKR